MHPLARAARETGDKARAIVGAAMFPTTKEMTMPPEDQAQNDNASGLTAGTSSEQAQGQSNSAGAPIPQAADPATEIRMGLTAEAAQKLDTLRALVSRFEQYVSREAHDLAAEAHDEISKLVESLRSHFKS